MFKGSESSSSMRISCCCWELGCMKQLLCIYLSGLTATEIKANLVDPIGINVSEVIIECLFGQQALFTYYMSKLHM